MRAARRERRRVGGSEQPLPPARRPLEVLGGRAQVEGVLGQLAQLVLPLERRERLPLGPYIRKLEGELDRALVAQLEQRREELVLGAQRERRLGPVTDSVLVSRRRSVASAVCRIGIGAAWRV